MSKALITTIALLAMTGVANAQHRHHHHHSGGGGNFGWGLGAGILGGLAIGSILTQPRYENTYITPYPYSEPYYNVPQTHCFKVFIGTDYAGNAVYRRVCERY